MIHILYVLNDTFKNGGTETVVFNYYNNINSNKFKIDFMVHALEEDVINNATYLKLINSGVSVFYVTPRRISVKNNRDDIKEVLKNNHYDIVHAHADAANTIILKYAKECGVQIRIAHSHSCKVPIKIEGIKTLLHVALLNASRYLTRYIATGFIACSDVSARWLFGNKLYTSNKVLILHNAFQLNRYAFQPRLREALRKEMGLGDCFVIGHVGRFSEEKNHLFLLEVFRGVKQKRPSSKLVLVGEGCLIEKIKERVEETNLTKDIIFTGNINNVNEMLNAFDIYCFPSKFEGLNVSLVEAQANGLKCLVSDVETVSKETAITDQVEFISITSPEHWIDVVSTYNGGRSVDSASQVEKSGYEIQNEVKRLEKYYAELYEESNSIRK